MIEVLLTEKVIQWNPNKDICIDVENSLYITQ